MPALLTPPTRRDASRIPPVPPLPPARDGGDDAPKEPMRRALLPPDRPRTRLIIALVVSLAVNIVFYRQVVAWGQHIRVVFAQSLQNRRKLPPAEITLLPPAPASKPAKSASPAPSPSPPPF